MMRSSGGKPTNDLHRSAIERSMFQKQKPAWKLKRIWNFLCFRNWRAFRFLVPLSSIA
jgi:hypothetical protein